MTEKYNLTLHHVGCLTRDIEFSKKVYADTLGLSSVSQTYIISDQQVKVCFIETAPNTYIELVEPSADNVPLQKMLKSKTSYYHLGFLTHDIDHVISQMQLNNCYLLNSFLSEAFNNKKCAFLFTEEMHLIELIQR